MRRMGDQDEASATAEHLVPIPLAVSNIANVRKNRSEAWNHFTAEPDLDKRARCNFCGCLIKYENGTSAMHAHVKRCKGNLDHDGNKRQKSGLSSTAIVEANVSSSPSYAKFDQEACENELVKMFVVIGLPFHYVENEVFRKFLSLLQPRFSVPSSITLARHILTLWDIERTNLKKFLSEHYERVCLTIDMWTSSQNMNFMCLTVHFVDNNWKLQKKILNFCQVTSHSGEVMAKTVELCMNGWGLSRVFSVTVDNALPNDIGIQYMKNKLLSWNNLVLKGDYIHMRCCTHILNLVVKEGLEEIDDSISRIRAAVKYIRSSPSRLSKFKACIEKKKIEYKTICLDFETRWNSTYLMLEAALMHQEAFVELELKDKKYVDELRKGKGVPTYEDWDHARLILPFLNIFYKATLRISGPSYVTSNIYMLEVFGIGKRICQMCESKDRSINMMAKRMRKMYDKYWGNPNGLNMLLLVAVVFDPRYKMEYVNWSIKQFFYPSKATNLKEKLESCLKSLFEEYNGPNGGSESGSQNASFDEDGNDDPYNWNQFLQSTGRKSNAKSELDKYLEESIETSSDLDVLNWWKLNSSRFPILANIAREVLAIPVSTVATKYVFTIGGRVLDPYRSSLPPKMVEALVCLQDWLKGTPSSLFSNEDFEELEKIEQEMVSEQDVAHSASISLDD